MIAQTGRAEPAAAPPGTGREPQPWSTDVREGPLLGEVLGVSPQVCRSRWTDLPVLTAHELARLRVDVLVAEAGTAYSELDDRDVDPTTEHLWVPDGDVPVACLRVIVDADGVRVVDRACARLELRRLGLTSALMNDLIARFGGGPLRALARPAAIAFFRQHGFEVSGPPVEAPGGQHLPMRRHPEAPWRY